MIICEKKSKLLINLDTALNVIYQDKKFLYKYFYEVCSFPSQNKQLGLHKDVRSLESIYRDGNHQVNILPFPHLIRTCMETHISGIFRRCENRFRQGLGAKSVGQGWISESLLFARLKAAFPNEVSIQHLKPEWIGRQHLDVFFPQINVAVEYQGAQHGKALAIFGGEAGLRVRTQLDKKKKDLCESNGCLLIEVYPGDPIEPIIEQISLLVRKASSESTAPRQSYLQPAKPPMPVSYPKSK